MKNRINPEQLWKDYGKMIMKRAHEMSRKYHQPFDDLLAEGVLRILKHLPQWNEERCDISTFVHQYSYYGMITYVLKNIRRREIPTGGIDPDEDKPFIEKEEKPNWFKRFVEEISEEARAMVRIFFEAPEELYEAIKPTSPIRSKEALKNYMIDVMDWSSDEFEFTFEEIRQCL